MASVGNDRSDSKARGRARPRAVFAFGGDLAGLLGVLALLVTGGAAAGPVGDERLRHPSCGIEDSSTVDALSAGSRGTFPVETRGWRTVPSAIRTDGVDEFRLEVEVDFPVERITLDTSPLLDGPVPGLVELQDDGTGPDATAGDLVFSAGPFRLSPGAPIPERYLGDPAGPVGIHTTSLGALEIEETSGETTTLLGNLEVGLVDPALAGRPVVQLGPVVRATPHLVEVRYPNRAAQALLRGVGSGVTEVAGELYGVLEDDYDFLMLFSSEKLQRVPSVESPNFTSGLHLGVRRDFEGTGKTLLDQSLLYGSAGRLQAVNLLDTHSRGILGNNAVHEIVHHWGAALDTTLGLRSGAHWLSTSSVGSMIGGFRWTERPDGSWDIDCGQGRNGGTTAGPLDLYLMGLADGASVPVLRVHSGDGPGCSDPVEPEDVVVETSIEDIQAVHGVRAPGPEAAQRDFRLLFVIESRDRWMNATERIYYDTLARHFTAPVDPGSPDPEIGHGWAPIGRYFGHGTSWRSDVFDRCGDGGVEACWLFSDGFESGTTSEWTSP